MLIVPTQPKPSQTLAVTLAGQACKIAVRVVSTGLFLDLRVNDAPIVVGVRCLDRVRLVRAAYLGFVGDLAWIDTAGAEDPQLTGLGVRWLLAYLEAGDL